MKKSPFYKKVLLPNIGWVLLTKDFIKLIKDEDNRTDYLVISDANQARKERYNERITGILKTSTGEYITAIAVSSPNKKGNDRSGSRVVISRIIGFLNSKLEPTKETSGVTYVTYPLLNLLSEDIYTYNILMGPLDSSVVEGCVNYLDSAEIFFKNKQISNMFEWRKKELSIKS